MQVRWKFKLKLTQAQVKLWKEWLVILRKHRNYALRERSDGYSANNQNVDTSVSYVGVPYCDIESRIECGSCCPLTCPLLKHGVVPNNLELALRRTTKKKQNGDKETVIKWDSASGIQMKVTTQLRHTRENFGAVNADVLQQNIARLDTAFDNFWKHGLGYPNFITELNSIEKQARSSVNQRD